MDETVWAFTVTLAIAGVVLGLLAAQKEKVMRSDIQKIVDDVTALKTSVLAVVSKVLANQAPPNTQTLGDDDVAALQQLSADIEAQTSSINAALAPTPVPPPSTTGS